MRILGFLVLLYIAIGLLADGAIGYFQPESEGTAVLRTFDSEGHAHDTVLSLLNDEGDLWVESGHWFRGWYTRVLANPEVELIRDGRTGYFRAAPIDTPDAVEKVTRLMGKGEKNSYWVGRALLLWAPIKPVRLFFRQPGT